MKSLPPEECEVGVGCNTSKYLAFIHILKQVRHLSRQEILEPFRYLWL